MFQLQPADQQSQRRQRIAGELHGRLLFQPGMTYNELARRWDNGARIKTTRLTPEFDLAALQKQYPGDSLVPLFVLNNATGELALYTQDKPPVPGPGDSIISLANAKPAVETAPKPEGVDRAAAVVS